MCFVFLFGGMCFYFNCSIKCVFVFVFYKKCFCLFGEMCFCFFLFDEMRFWFICCIKCVFVFLFAKLCFLFDEMTFCFSLFDKLCFCFFVVWNVFLFFFVKCVLVFRFVKCFVFLLYKMCFCFFCSVKWVVVFFVWGNAFYFFGLINCVFFLIKCKTKNKISEPSVRWWMSQGNVQPICHIPDKGWLPYINTKRSACCYLHSYELHRA